MMQKQVSNASGMTPFEMMMVMLVITISLIAIISFHKAWQSICNYRFTTALRKSAAVFEQYPILNGSFPKMATPGVVPPGTEELLRQIAWEKITPLGGQWDWVTNVPKVGRGIRIYMPTVSEKRMKKIDENIDDGNLHSGRFQLLEDGTGYLYIIE